MKKFTKIGFSILAVVALSLVLVIKPGDSKIKAYYSGDAINYYNQIVVSSTNTDSLEIFKLTGNSLLRVLKFKPFDPVYSKYGAFSDSKLSEEHGRLYVYVTSDYTIYKYDITDLNNAKLEKKVKNTYFEWYSRVDKFGDQIITISDQGIKIWDQDLNTIDSYNFKPSNRYSIRSNNSGQFIFAFDGSKLQIFDRTNRSLAKELAVDYSNLDTNHKAYYDLINNEIYVADDIYTKKLDFDGNILGSFKHLNQTGYDVDSTLGNDYVYFSNGYGVVKLKKDDMKLATYAFTTNLSKSMGWAMGLKILNSDAGDRVVVFNNSSILVLDQNLKKIASIAAEEEATSAPQETLFLILNHNIGVPGSTVTLFGGGFFPQESLVINFAGSRTLVQADWKGRFTQDLIVPALSSNQLPGTQVDIKVDGQGSGLTYSTSFKIQ